MKKNVKLLIIGLIAFVFSLNTTYAKTYNSIAELGNDVLSVNPKAESFYLIGEYVFTTGYGMNSQDVMLAGRSINVKDINGKINTDGIYKEMTIYTINAHYGNNGVVDGWEQGKTLFGEDTLTTDMPINVNYIDYNKTYYHVNADTVVSNALQNIKSNYFNVKLEENKTVTFTVTDRTIGIEGIKNTGTNIIVELVKAFNQYPGIESFTITIDNHNLEISRDKVKDLASLYENEFKTFVQDVTSKSYDEAKLVDLVNKTFTVKVTVNEETILDDATSGKLFKDYTVNFVELEVDTHEYVENNIVSVDNSLYDIEMAGENITTKVLDASVDVKVGMSSGVLAGLMKLAKEEYIKEIKFNYPTKPEVTLTINKNTTFDNLISWYETNVEKIFDSSSVTNKDLVDKEFTFQIIVDDSKAVDANGTPLTYTVKFTADKVTVTYNEDTEKTSTKEFYVGEKFAEPTAGQPTKEGYTFDGWYVGETKYVVGETKITEAVTVTAKWLRVVTESGLDTYITGYDISDAKNGFTSSYDNDTNTIKTEIKTPSQSILEIAKTGLFTAMREFINASEIAKVEVLFNGKTYTVTTEEELNTEVYNVLMAMTNSESMTTLTSKTLHDIAGLKISVKVYLNPDYAKFDESVTKEYAEYSIEFNENGVISLESLQETSKNSVTAINDSLNHVFQAKIEGNNVIINYNSAYASDYIIAHNTGTGLVNCLSALFANGDIKALQLIDPKSGDVYTTQGGSGVKAEITTGDFLSASKLMSYAVELVAGPGSETTLSEATFAQFFSDYKDTTIQVRLVPAEGKSLPAFVGDTYIIKLGQEAFTYTAE